MTEDGQLLRHYARQGSQTAFSQLVTRYLNLVYSICLREVGDAGLAEDVTQVVFLLLARKAPTFGPDTRLPGWLFQTARFACKNARRREARRKLREQEVEAQMLSENQEENALWDRIEPSLNDALASLGTKDREAVLLRFANGLNFQELGEVLNTSEDAARMRLNRAMERLRQFFVKEGIQLSGTAWIELITERTSQAAPATCAANAAQIANGIVAGGSNAGLIAPHAYPIFKGALQTMTMTKITVSTVGLLITLAAVLPLVSLAQSHRSNHIQITANPKQVTPPSQQRKLLGQTLPQDLPHVLQAREQHLSHLTFDWQIQSETNLKRGEPRDAAFTQTWHFIHNGTQMLVSGIREEGATQVECTQYYNGPNGLLSADYKTTSRVPVAPVPPQIWGDSGDSFRWREPFQTGLNLTPEHFTFLTGINPLSLYGATWTLTTTTARTWVFHTRVLPGLAPTDANAYSIDLTLSRRFGGAPALIVWTRGKQTMQFQAQSYRQQGSNWICDKVEVVDDYPGIHTIHQIWTLQADRTSSQIVVPVTTGTQVMDYRTIGLNLTTDDYLAAIQQNPQSAAIYAWPGYFQDIDKLGK